jgi:glycosyltransferase involved in cell wall biosynthesis
VFNAGEEIMIEVSVVLPCLNEQETIGSCITKARESFRQMNIQGEVIVVDNGSTDDSARVAQEQGARVVSEARKGYGNALRRGIEEAQGEYIVMGDADDTYDFTLTGAFVTRLKEGYDLVMGSRFGGNILPGAMTWSHRYIGNPILSGMLRLFFGGMVSDSHCGIRAFTKTAYQRMDLHTTGMEFASEMVVHALKKKLRISEIPITYYARLGESKLSSFRDAWRHVRFMLLYSPDYLFLLPGTFLFIVSMLVTLRLTAGDVYLFGRAWGMHVMVFSAMGTILGWQITTIGMTAKIFAHTIGLEDSPLVGRVLALLTLERALAFSLVLIASGSGIIGYIIYIWSQNNFGPLTEVGTGLLALTLIVMGFQTVFTAFLFSMLQIRFR